jgi:hypothetical protein
MKQKPTDLEDDYKLTLVYGNRENEIIYCKKKEIDEIIEAAKRKNKTYKHSMPEKLIKQELK